MTYVTFPAGVGSSFQMGLSALCAMAPQVAAHIAALQVPQLGRFLTENGIHPKYQPEAIRQMAFGYGLFNAQTWIYDPAKVEQAASQLVRRGEVQLAACKELLAQFNLLEREPIHDFERKKNDHILENLLNPIARKFSGRGISVGSIWDTITKFKLEKDVGQRAFYGEKLRYILTQLAESDPHWQASSDVDLEKLKEAFYYAPQYGDQFNFSDGEILQCAVALLKANEPRWCAFNNEVLKGIFPRLAEYDQRWAVRFMATVAANDTDPIIRKCALDSIEQNIGYLKPRDYMEVATNIIQLFELEDTDSPASEQAYHLLVKKIAPELDLYELGHLARVAYEMSTRVGIDSDESIDVYEIVNSRAYEIAKILTANMFHRAPQKQDNISRSALMDEAIGESSSVVADDASSTTEGFLQKRNNLLGIGFRQIGASQYFKRDGFIIHIERDGRPTIFSNKGFYSKEYKIDGFRKIEGGIEVLYRDMNTDGYPTHEVKTIGESDDLFKVIEFTSFARSRTLGQQLIEAGFEEDPSAEGIFRRSFANRNHDSGRATEILAFVRNGSLRFLGYIPKEACCEHGELMTAETEFYHRNGALVLRTGGLEVKVGKSGFEKPELLIPLDELVENQPSVIDPTIEPMEVRVDPQTGFKYGGVNTTSDIRGLKSINGEFIGELEMMMRPKRTGHYGSIEGFLGHTESLLDVMAADNDWVLGKGLTHQQLAKVLKSVLWVTFTLMPRDLWKEFMEKMRSNDELRKFEHEYGEEAALRYYFHEKGLGEIYEEKIQHTSYSRASHIVEWVNKRGQRFAAIGLQSFGTQGSPFRDSLAGSREAMVINLDKKTYLEIADLVPELIEKYGFYEGHGTPYRVSPQDIVRVFDFLTKSV